MERTRSVLLERALLAFAGALVACSCAIASPQVAHAEAVAAEPADQAAAVVVQSAAPEAAAAESAAPQVAVAEPESPAPAEAQAQAQAQQAAAPAEPVIEPAAIPEAEAVAEAAAPTGETALEAGVIAEQAEAAGQAPSQEEAEQPADGLDVQADGNVISPILEGAYVVKPFAAPYAKALEVYDDSIAPGRVWAHDVDGTYSQMWYFQRMASGLFSAFSMHSGLALDISGDELAQAEYTGSDGQLFEVLPSGRYFSLVSASGRALTLSDESVVSQSYSGNANQLFTLSSAPLIVSGMYSYLSCANTDAYLTVSNESADAGAQLVASSASSSLAQKFVMSRSGSNSGMLRAAVSNLYAAPSGSNVVQGEEGSTWNVTFSTSGSRRGLVFVQSDGRALTFTASAGTPLQLSSIDYSTSQAFLPLSRRLIDSSTYFIAAANGRVLDVYDGGRAVHSNVWLVDRNDTNAQKFEVAHVRNDLYTIRNVASWRPVGAYDGNAELLNWTQEPDQLWRAEPAGSGMVTFINAFSSTVLNAVGDAAENGANANLDAPGPASSHRFKLTETGYSTDRYVDLKVPSVWQNPELPTGCESVALTNALLYYGFNIEKTTIADDWMPWSDSDFVYSFLGNPHSSNGAAIMAPGITNTANAFLSGNGSPLRAYNITGTGFGDLYSYLDRGVPVVVWSTMYMVDRGSASGSSDGYTMYGNTHAVTLAGYDLDADEVLVSDPLSGSVWRDVGRFSYLYDIMGQQAVVIE